MLTADKSHDPNYNYQNKTGRDYYGISADKMSHCGSDNVKKNIQECQTMLFVRQ
jgi:hypothetical protein